MLLNNIITLCNCGLSNLFGYSYFTEYEPLAEKEHNNGLEDDCNCGLCKCVRETSYFLFRQLTIKKKN